MALAILEADGGPLSSGERIVTLAAWAFWNNAANVTLSDVAYRLDSKHAIAIASLIVAVVRGPDAIDDWLAASDAAVAK